MANPAWFDEEHYLKSKLNQLQTQEPSANWTHTALLQALDEHGFTPYSHFLQFGAAERLSPNPLFNTYEYLQAKLQQLEVADPGVSWNLESLFQTIVQAGMSVWEHFQQHGWREGVNPSNAFNLDGYWQAKLAQLQTDEPAVGWTNESMIAAFVSAGLNPIAHYAAYGRGEGVEVSPVPEADRVPSDPNPIPEEMNDIDWGEFDWGDVDWGDIDFGDGSGEPDFDLGDLQGIFDSLYTSLSAMGMASINVEEIQNLVLNSGLVDPENLNPDGSGVKDPAALVTLVWEYFYGVDPIEIIGEIPGIPDMGMLI